MVLVVSFFNHWSEVLLGTILVTLGNIFEWNAILTVMKFVTLISNLYNCIIPGCKYLRSNSVAKTSDPTRFHLTKKGFTYLEDTWE